MARCEVTFREYLEFINDPAVRSEIRPEDGSRSSIPLIPWYASWRRSAALEAQFMRSASPRCPLETCCSWLRIPFTASRSKQHHWRS